MASLFFSYAHEDEALRNELEKHLTLLKRQGVISAWHDRRIIAGTEFDERIDQHVEKDELILLLVPQITVVSPPKRRLPDFRGGLPNFPSRLRGVWSSRR